VESSGGVAGANITVRGLPSASDAPFVSYQLQGMPIYPAASLSFQDNSSIFREDETIGSVQAVRGGPTSVFSNAQPGLTVNHVLKEGTDETHGLIKASFTNYGTRRADALIQGKLADDLYYMVGGYVTQSPGIRSTQFNSENGKQITLNVTKKFEGGKISFYSRITDDHGAWYLPHQCAGHQSGHLFATGQLLALCPDRDRAGPEPDL
jgi:outer membrane receptor protein involved in Fe transport